MVLTGYLDDGTSGLMAVKRCGGVAVVQDPGDAAYPDMPQSALDNVDVDHCLPLADIGPLLAQAQGHVQQLRALLLSGD